MAIGYLEAQKIGPIPADTYPQPRDEDQNTIPYSDFVKTKIMGPQDPLAGPTSPDDVSGLTSTTDRMIALLEKNLIAVRATHPTMTIPVIGPSQLAANTGEKYTFEIGGKKVPALNIFIQNNTGAICYIGIEDPPSLQGIQVPANGGILNISDVAVSFIGIFVTATSIINGVANANFPSTGFSTSNITIYAWSNPEWDKIWGMTS